MPDLPEPEPKSGTSLEKYPPGLQSLVGAVIFLVFLFPHAEMSACIAVAAGDSTVCYICLCVLFNVVATGSSQGPSDQMLTHHGSSSSLASSACSIQSGCTEKAIDNVSMKDSVLEGRYMKALFVLSKSYLWIVTCAFSHLILMVLFSVALQDIQLTAGDQPWQTDLTQPHVSAFGLHQCTVVSQVACKVK